MRSTRAQSGGSAGMIVSPNCCSRLPVAACCNAMKSASYSRSSPQGSGPSTGVCNRSISFDSNHVSLVYPLAMVVILRVRRSMVNRNRMQSAASEFQRSTSAFKVQKYGLQQLASGQVAHQGTEAERPPRRFVCMHHAVVQCAQFRRRDAHVIAHDMRESLPRSVTVLCRREHRAQKQHETVWVGVVAVERLCHEVERIAADLRQRARAFEREALGARHAPRAPDASHVGDAELRIQQTDEQANDA